MPAERAPPEFVDDPGITMSRLEPNLPISLSICSRAPSPRPTVSMTAAMPMRMPSMVSSDRIRRPFSASAAVRMVSAHPMTRLLALFGEQTVVDPHDPGSPRGDVGLVGDEDDGAPCRVQLVEQVENVVGGD